MLTSLIEQTLIHVPFFVISDTYIAFIIHINYFEYCCTYIRTIF